ncbi:MAG: hypothetical protein EPO42_14955 [Gallionellaceae bacterium]|nr:MAG: hypothetical protein EPO42_14955 [Gallionellaceae bacterium]
MRAPRRWTAPRRKRTRALTDRRLADRTPGQTAQPPRSRQRARSGAARWDEPRWSAPRFPLQGVVYEILLKVPRGKVVTYGQLALLAGSPRAARQVGWIAHAGRSDLPWQRVVNRFGGLASGYRGGREGHKRDLMKDGVRVRPDLTVDLGRYQWWPVCDPHGPRSRRPNRRSRCQSS